jgi:hypothetical protein
VLLLKRDRNDKRATLYVTSRDAAEGEYSLTMTDRNQWTLDGDSLEAAAQSAQTARATAGLGDKSIEVINKISEYPEGISPKDLKTLLPHIPDGTIDAYIKRAFDAGRIEKAERGKYTPIRTASSASFESPQTYSSDTSCTPLGEQE